jgi:hypothetical protein
MRPLVTVITVGLLSANSLAASVPRRNWSKLIIGTWFHTCRLRPGRILVFHADGRWGVRKIDDPRPEDIRGRRWHIEGDMLILRYPSDNGFESHPYKIVSFTPNEFITGGEYPCNYTRTHDSQ